MVLTAPKGTTQIPATRVSGMREKPNTALSAVDDATPKLAVGLQDRVQGGLILPDKRLGAVVLVPIRPKRENLLDGYGKKARFSVMMWIVFDTPSSYPADANASRGRARFFVRYGREPEDPPTQTLRPLFSTQAVPLAGPTQSRCTPHLQTTT